MATTRSNQAKRHASILQTFRLLASVLLCGTSVCVIAGVNDNFLSTGETLSLGQQIQSQNGEFALRFTETGNLVLVKTTVGANATPLWKSATSNQRAQIVTLEASGNLTIRTAGGARIWASETGSSKADTLRLNNQGEFALLREQQVIWSPTGFSGGDDGGNNGGTPGDAPNIVLILADDLPWHGTSVRMEAGNIASSTSYQDMPNLEQLASQGVTFSHAYATSGVCGPSRANIQLGTSPVRSRYTANSGTGMGDQTAGIDQGKSSELLNEPRSRIDLPDQAITLAEQLKSLGYKTAHFGKWHLYGGGPRLHGYDVSDGDTNNDQGNPDRYGSNDPKGMFSMTQRANSFMRQAAAENKPFFVQLSHYVAHKRYQARPQTIRKYDNLLRNGLGNRLGLTKPIHYENAATQLAMMEDLDTTIGQLMQTLRELGEADNTYVLFTGDNGYEWATTTNNLRGGKWWLFEAGIRVPLIIKGPNIAQGARSHINVSHYDFYPTFVDWAGGRVDQLTEIDGVSLKDHLELPDRIPGFSDRNLYFHYPHYRESTPQSAVINDRYKLLMFYDYLLTGGSNANGLYLFDLGHGDNNYATQNEARNLTSSQLGIARQMQLDFENHVQEASAWPEYAVPTRNTSATNARPVNVENVWPPIRR